MCSMFQVRKQCFLCCWKWTLVQTTRVSSLLSQTSITTCLLHCFCKTLLVSQWLHYSYELCWYQDNQIQQQQQMIIECNCDVFLLVLHETWCCECFALICSKCAPDCSMKGFNEMMKWQLKYCRFSQHLNNCLWHFYIHIPALHIKLAVLQCAQLIVVCK